MQSLADELLALVVAFAGADALQLAQTCRRFHAEAWVRRAVLAMPRMPPPRWAAALVDRFPGLRDLLPRRIVGGRGGLCLHTGNGRSFFAAYAHSPAGPDIFLADGTHVLLPREYKEMEFSPGDLYVVFVGERTDVIPMHLLRMSDGALVSFAAEQNDYYWLCTPVVDDDGYTYMPASRTEFMAGTNRLAIYAPDGSPYGSLRAQMDNWVVWSHGVVALIEEELRVLDRDFVCHASFPRRDFRLFHHLSAKDLVFVCICTAVGYKVLAYDSRDWSAPALVLEQYLVRWFMFEHDADGEEATPMMRHGMTGRVRPAIDDSGFRSLRFLDDRVIALDYTERAVYELAL